MATDTERRIRDLEYENERLRDEERRRQEDADCAYRERRERQRQEWREAQCTAEDWPEGFRKGLTRARQEARDEAERNKEDADKPGFKPWTFFSDWVKTVEQAQAIYNEEWAKAEKQIQALKTKALKHIAHRVEAETGEKDLAEALREDRPDYLTYW